MRCRVVVDAVSNPRPNRSPTTYSFHEEFNGADLRAVITDTAPRATNVVALVMLGATEHSDEDCEIHRTHGQEEQARHCAIVARQDDTDEECASPAEQYQNGNQDVSGGGCQSNRGPSHRAVPYL